MHDYTHTHIHTNCISMCCSHSWRVRALWAGDCEPGRGTCRPRPGPASAAPPRRSDASAERSGSAGTPDRCSRRRVTQASPLHNTQYNTQHTDEHIIIVYGSSNVMYVCIYVCMQGVNKIVTEVASTVLVSGVEFEWSS